MRLHKKGVDLQPIIGGNSFNSFFLAVLFAAGPAQQLAVNWPLARIMRQIS